MSGEGHSLGVGYVRMNARNEAGIKVALANVKRAHASR